MDVPLQLLITVFVTGVGMGFTIAAPVGPIGLLCIQCTLTHGFKAGVAAGFGTALADALYAAIAAFGITAVTLILVTIQVPVRTIGLLAMLWLAWRIWRDAGQAETASAPPASTVRTVVQTFFLTLANPATIMSFVALFLGSGVGLSLNVQQPALLVAGTFTGSMLWWLILSGVVARIRTKLTPRALVWITRGAALMIAGFAISIAAQFYPQLWK